MAFVVCPLVLLWFACTPSGGGSSGSTSSSSGGVDAGSMDAGDTMDAGSCATTVTLETEPTCNACLEQHCCTTSTNCQDTPDCVAYKACADACTTPACRQQCQTMHPDGVWLWSGMITCQRNNCGAQCGVTPGACGGIGLTTTQCNTCVRAQCCTQATACATSDACNAFIYQCIDLNGCGGTEDACGRACQLEYPDAFDVFGALQSCARTSCPVDCAGL